jgi:large subunit ribosomal protein L28
MKCELCGKIVRFGCNVSFSKRHTKRQWKPNIHKAKVVIDGKERKANICTRCLRTQHKLT